MYMYILQKFEQESGLRINVEKTQAVWIGEKINDVQYAETWASNGLKGGAKKL